MGVSYESYEKAKNRDYNKLDVTLCTRKILNFTFLPQEVCTVLWLLLWRDTLLFANLSEGIQ